MARLPQPGAGIGNWGSILNGFLQQEHASDGSLKIRSDGTFNAFYKKPDAGIPLTDLSSSTQDSINYADTLVINVKKYGAKGDGTTDDTTSIASAIEAASALGGGEVFFPQGTYIVNSSERTDAISSVSGTTFNDASCVASDVGSYVIGAIQTGALQVVSVNPGVSFTVDYAPGTTAITSVVLVRPGIVLPPGVSLRGTGSSESNNSFGTGNSPVSRIKDNGSGICILIRGAYITNASWQFNYSIKKLSIWGNGNGNPNWGVFVANGAWFLDIYQCEIGYFKTANLGFDGNINSCTVKDSLIIGGGSSISSSYTGGCITHPYWSQPSSSLVFENCFFDGNCGWGITDGSGQGAYGISLMNCQFNNTVASSATDSGTSAALQSHGNADGLALVVGGWSESAALYDLDLHGVPTITSFSMGSAHPNAHLRATSGVSQLIGCRFENGSGPSVTFGSGGNITWIGGSVNDGYFYSGCGFTNNNFPALGSTSTMQLTGTLTFAGIDTTGSGSATLGSNSPATTNSAPYTWIKAMSSDGSTVYIPAWK